MGKTKIGVAVVPEMKDAPPEYSPPMMVVTQSPQQPTPVMEDQKEADRWYIISILSAFFCLFPLNIIGLVHSMIAKHEAERRNVLAYQRRIHQTKCWTGWSIALGTAFLIVMIVTFGVAVARHRRGFERRWDKPMKMEDIVFSSPAPDAAAQRDIFRNNERLEDDVNEIEEEIMPGETSDDDWRNVDSHRSEDGEDIDEPEYDDWRDADRGHHSSEDGEYPDDDDDDNNNDWWEQWGDSSGDYDSHDGSDHRDGHVSRRQGGRRYRGWRREWHGKK